MEQISITVCGDGGCGKLFFLLHQDPVISWVLLIINHAIATSSVHDIFYHLADESF